MICKRLILVFISIQSLICYTTKADPGSGLKFVKNKTQWSKQIHFNIKVPGGTMSIQPGLFSYSFIDERKLKDLHEQTHGINKEQSVQDQFKVLINGHIVQTNFIGSDSKSVPIPYGESQEYYNFFLGMDSSRWSTDVHAYEGVIYPCFYPGIDLKVYSRGENIKYDFIVSPGATVSAIKFEYMGADEVYIKNGDLYVHSTLADIIEKRPFVYQIIDDTRRFIKCSYELNDGKISFCLEESYDPCYELVIDPLLIFSTYSGFSADNWGSAATPGENGKLYSTGVTSLNNGGTFPTSPGSFQTSYGGLYDVAIYKYDSTGSQLQYTTFLGGSASESPHSIVMTSTEELLVLGTTSSVDFPTSSAAFDKSFNGGTPESNVINYTNGSDIFVSKISKTGNQLLASSYFGGSLNDGLNPTGSPLVRNYGDQLRGDIISDLNGDVYVSTVTSSSNFPVANSFDLTYNGGSTDGLLMKLKADLSTVIWATFLGGSQVDASHSIQIDRSGNLFVAGGTFSTDFPSTSGAYQLTNSGNADGWIAKIKADGSLLLHATFTGTNLFNQVYFLDLDQQENVYVYGQTEGSFPTTAGVYKNNNSGQFLQKFDNSLSTLIFSTVFGSGIGVPNISPTAFLVNDCNNIYLAGWGGELNGLLGFWKSTTTGMAVTSDALQKTTSGSDFYLMVLSGDATQLLYGTYLGGTTSRTHLDGGTCRFDKGGVVYHAVCAGCSYNSTGLPVSDFPSTPNAWSRTNGSKNCNNAAFKFDLSSLRARLQTNSVSLNQPGLNQLCIGEKIVFQNNSIGGETYYWDFGDGNKISKTDKADITYKYARTGNYTVKLKAVDVGTCLGKDSTKVSVSVFEPLGFVGADLTMCFDAGAQLTAGGGVTYQWKASDNSFSSNQATPKVNPKDKTIYYVTVTDRNGCTKKDTVNLKVVPGIDINFTVERVNYDCEGWPSIKVASQTDPLQNVFFDFGDGTTSDLPSVIHEYSKQGMFSIRQIGNREACVYEKEILVPVFELKVPNVITPDQSPGFNDTFQIEYGGKPIAQSGIGVTMIIFNRWGGKVYESKNYLGDWAAKDVPSGTYYFETEIQGETSCKGWVQVIK